MKQLLLSDDEEESEAEHEHKGEKISLWHPVACGGALGLAVIPVEEGGVPEHAFEIPQHLEVVTCYSLLVKHELALAGVFSGGGQKLEKKGQLKGT